MRREADAYFCDDCPQRGTLHIALEPQDFMLLYDDVVSEAIELYAWMSDASDVTHGADRVSESLSIVPANESQAKRLKEVWADREYKERELGEAFCRKIGECTGMTISDAGPICPAFNNVVLKELL